MAKINCWEFKKCCCEPDGSRAKELGAPCTASTDEASDGKNNGKNGGRYCWKVFRSYTEGEKTGMWAKKILKCLACEFYSKVKEEEGDNYKA
jgi:hypothetical protein